ncbi:MAG: hypothetical protein RIC56_15025 [Pseudomonadales bacterium]
MQRLTDLVERFKVYALCVPCGRMEPVDLSRAIARLGETATVADLRARVRCQGCRQRSRDVRVVYVGPQDRPTSFRYRR